MRGERGDGVCWGVLVVVVGGEVRAVPVVIWVVGKRFLGGLFLEFGFGVGF